MAIAGVASILKYISVILCCWFPASGPSYRSASGRGDLSKRSRTLCGDLLSCVCAAGVQLWTMCQSLIKVTHEVYFSIILCDEPITTGPYRFAGWERLQCLWLHM